MFTWQHQHHGVPTSAAQNKPLLNPSSAVAGVQLSPVLLGLFPIQPLLHMHQAYFCNKALTSASVFAAGNAVCHTSMLPPVVQQLS